MSDVCFCILLSSRSHPLPQKATVLEYLQIDCMDPMFVLVFILKIISRIHSDRTNWRRTHCKTFLGTKIRGASRQMVSFPKLAPNNFVICRFGTGFSSFWSLSFKNNTGISKRWHEFRLAFTWKITQFNPFVRRE